MYTVVVLAMTFSGGCVADRGGDCGTFVMMVSMVVIAVNVV